MTDNIIVINSRDNVAVALMTLSEGETAAAKGLEPFTVLEKIPASHKVALQDIAAGEEIIKYGEIIAISTQEIKKGQWVHTHNLESERWKK
ncbi:MAG: UxaA family hydrolase [Desulfomonile tiedjei]|nr:UxaA family hydrolase [Desulfomonile tiedjei]